MDKIIDPAFAAGAYAGSAKAARSPGMESAENSFASHIKKAADSAIETMKSGEKAQAQAVAGTASLTDVVAAVTDAEMTLHTVVSVRDRMISAYQNIMRMPI